MVDEYLRALQREASYGDDPGALALYINTCLRHGKYPQHQLSVNYTEALLGSLPEKVPLNELIELVNLGRQINTVIKMQRKQLYQTGTALVGQVTSSEVVKYYLSILDLETLLENEHFSGLWGVWQKERGSFDPITLVSLYIERGRPQPSSEEHLVESTIHPESAAFWQTNDYRRKAYHSVETELTYQEVLEMGSNLDLIL